MRITTMNRFRKGFTLLELLIVIAIIGVVLAVVMPNLLGARQRARDAKRKSELAEFKTALNIYYADYQSYPADEGAAPYSNINGCGANGTSACPAGCSVDFSAGAACNTVFMKKFPENFDGGDSSVKYYASGTNDFCLAVPLENGLDPDIAASQSKCSTACGANCSGGTNYCICAD